MSRTTRQHGFFACCADKLVYIINYFNRYKKLPEDKDFYDPNIFYLYKPKNFIGDITTHFFKNDDMSEIEYSGNINCPISIQISKYNSVNYPPILPFIKKYFTPSDEIINIMDGLIKKYNIDAECYCAVYYRGTDKRKETKIGSYDTYISKMKEIKNMDNNIKFMVQSDETEFINAIKKEFNECLSFSENVSITANTNKGVHLINHPDQNYHTIKIFFAILCVISKCKYIICSSGNCSIWTMFYRGHANNVFQFLNDVWL
jgi:hypothetical protein